MPSIRWLFSSTQGLKDRLIPRWIFLRALGLIYFSAFYSLVFQIRGLIGQGGILPANEYLEAVGKMFGPLRFWFAPTLLWLSTSSHMLTGICCIGMIAALLLVVNFWPRAMLVVCFLCFLSFVTAAQDFSGYQSDGMLLEAGLLSIFLAPRGLWPGLAPSQPPIRAAYYLLQWEWFRIYFESGMVKLLSGDPQWRNLTAMDEYYQNGPLPTWIGWYVQHLPHKFHAFTAGATLVMELGFVWMLFLPRRWRIICFFIVTPWEIGVTLTANYTFLNYLVLSLGFLLLDDKFILDVAPARWREWIATRLQRTAPAATHTQPATLGEHLAAVRIAVTAVLLTWIAYNTAWQMLTMVWRSNPLPAKPVAALEPFRVANQYGLFAVMTRGRYEIEFQGSNDGQNWKPYPFRYKPQDIYKRPGIYAPYQPRFDWNLWFASLGSWRDNNIVPSTEERLLNNAPDVIKLFAGNPFPDHPPQMVRAVLWQYWFTSLQEKRETGAWWTRRYLGLYAPTLKLGADGKLEVVEWPTELPPRR